VKFLQSKNPVRIFHRAEFAHLSKSGRQSSPLKGGGKEGVPVPLPTLGEGVRGWGEARKHTLHDFINAKVHFIF
jgi:hypothetical protein